MSNIPNTPDSGVNHWIVQEAVAWLVSTDSVPITREAAEGLLPHWTHHPNLTDAERQAVLDRFVPRAEYRAQHPAVAEYRRRLDAWNTIQERGLGELETDR